MRIFFISLITIFSLQSFAQFQEGFNNEEARDMIAISFDDKFINGKSFEFAYDRGVLHNSTADDDNNVEKGFF